MAPGLYPNKNRRLGWLHKSITLHEGGKDGDRKTNEKVEG